MVVGQLGQPLDHWRLIIFQWFKHSVLLLLIEVFFILYQKGVERNREGIEEVVSTTNINSTGMRYLFNQNKESLILYV